MHNIFYMNLYYFQALIIKGSKFWESTVSSVLEQNSVTSH